MFSSLEFVGGKHNVVPKPMPFSIQQRSLTFKGHFWKTPFQFEYTASRASAPNKGAFLEKLLRKVTSKNLPSSVRVLGNLTIYAMALGLATSTPLE